MTQNDNIFVLNNTVSTACKAFQSRNLQCHKILQLQHMTYS